MTDPATLVEVYALPMARFLAFAAVVLVIYRGLFGVLRAWRAGRLRRFVWSSLAEHLILLGILAYYVETLFLRPVQETPDRFDLALINLLYALYLVLSSIPRLRRATDPP